MKKVIASLVLGFVASVSFAAAPVAASASAPVVKSEVVAPAAKTASTHTAVKKVHVAKAKAHRVVKAKTAKVKAKTHAHKVSKKAVVTPAVTPASAPVVTK